MKKLYFIITLVFISLLVSCTQEELMNKAAEDSRVNISVEFPKDIAVTRAQIVIPATHKLRCIIEVWTKSSNPTLKYRKEIAVEGGAMPTFDFGLRPGDYTCLMWSDFIKRDAISTEVTTESEVIYSHFEDTYYDTSDLNRITVKEDAIGNLFDTDLCDGFYANLEISKKATSVEKVVKMTRPFAKLIVKENDAEKFASLKGLTVSCRLPKSFSVTTGEPGTEMIPAVYNKNFEPTDNSQVLFSGYFFVPSTGLSVESFILSFTTDAGKSICEVPGESIMLQRNQRMVASGELISGGEIEPNPDPEPSPEPEPSSDPQIGDYFFIDGTWSSELTDENKDKCVGIVYATGALEGDDISSYGEAAQSKSIKGYVMALKNINVGSMGFEANIHAISGRPLFYKKDGNATASDVTLFTAPATIDKSNHTGYTKTNFFLNSDNFTQNSDNKKYPALQALSTWKKANDKVQNASSWYMPSLAQLHLAAGSCYGYEKKNGFAAISKHENLNKAFNNAINSKVAEAFTNNTGAGYYVYTSCLTTDSGISFFQINKSGTNINWKNNKPADSFGLIRPFLTIIK